MVSLVTPVALAATPRSVCQANKTAVHALRFPTPPPMRGNAAMLQCSDVPKTLHPSVPLHVFTQGRT